MLTTSPYISRDYDRLMDALADEYVFRVKDQPRLPTPGGDDGVWGEMLNEFLNVSHNSDGSIKSEATQAAGAGTYSKPVSGIPATDLDSTTQTALGSIGSRYAKPSGGIPTTDLATSVQSVLNNAITTLPTGTTAAGLQAAISALPNGGTIRLAPGSYTFTSTVTYASNIIIEGAGENATIIHITHGNDAFAGTDLSHVGLKNLHIIGPGQTVGAGCGVHFKLSGSHGNATFYVDIENVYIEQFAVDGVAIATPIVSKFKRVVVFHAGRHGFNCAGDPVLQSDGTSTVWEACFAAGCWAAGYHLKQMAYSALNGCAADANGIAYEYDTCIGVTENGCGSEEPYDFSAHNAGYSGYSRKISNSKVALNTPYAIGNIGTSYYVTSGSRVTITDLYEGSPGNPDSPVNNPTSSLKVDAGCFVQLLGKPTCSTAMSLATGTTTQPMAWVQLTQAEYDALTPDPNTLYVVVG